jgi:hemolysin activation/secretion protein
LGKCVDSPIPDSLDFLGFFDFGSETDIHPVGEPGHAELASFGVGAIYRMDRHVDLRLDYGWQLIRNNALLAIQIPPDRSRSRAHIAVVVRF